MIAEKLKKSILQEAIQGRLVPQNPDDEPASIMLEKIRGEKRELIKAGKIKVDKAESIIFRGSDSIKGTIAGRFYERIGKGDPVDITENLPFEIPESWEWIKLDELVIEPIKRGKSPKYAERSGTRVFAQKCNLKNGTIDLSLSKFLDNNVLKRYSTSDYIQDGDIIINSTGEGTLGRIGFFQDKYKIDDSMLVPDSHIAIIRSTSHYFKRFLFLIMKSYQNYLEKMGTGSTKQTELHPSVILKLYIPSPPFSEQKRIVSALDELLPKVSEYQKIETKLHQVNISFPDKFRKSVLHAAVQGKLVPQNPDDEPASELLQKVRKKRSELIKSGKIKKPKNESYIFRREDSWFEKTGKIEKCIDEELPFKIPNNWAWERLGNIGTFIRGSGIKRSDITSEGVGCIRYGEIYTTYNISFSEPKSFTSPDLSKSLKKIDTNDLLFTLTGENKEEIGKTVAYTGDVNIYAGGDLGIYKYHFQNPLFLSYLFNSPYGILKKSEVGTGNIIVHISCDKLSNILIPIAPINEQQLIVHSIHSIFSIL